MNKKNNTVKGSDDNCFKAIVASPKGKEMLEHILKQVLRKDAEKKRCFIIQNWI